MRLSFKILENSSEIQKRILDALLEEAEDYMKNGISDLRKNIPGIISRSIISQPEYQSLISGKLRLEFGIPDASSKIAAIIRLWTNNVKIKYEPPIIVGAKIKSSFTMEMIKTDYEDILGSDYAYVYDSIRGYRLPWLEWLLLDGQKILVPKYEVKIGFNNRSRTGEAIMKPSKKSWKVPSEFAGTQNNNWITRAIDSVSDDIQNSIERSFK